MRDNSSLAAIHHGLARIVRITEHVSAALLLVVVLCNAAQIFCRYVLVDPLSFTDEAMRYCMIWVTFLAGSGLVFRREHMAASLFDHPRFVRMRRMAQALVLLATVVYAGIFTWNGLPLALRNAYQLSPSAQIPMIYPYVAVPVGGVMVIIYALWLLFVPSAPLVQDLDEDEAY
jgi:TRAP-type C4-dicarboxylate transport system permease small subunit